MSKLALGIALTTLFFVAVHQAGAGRSALSVRAIEVVDHDRAWVASFEQEAAADRK